MMTIEQIMTVIEDGKPKKTNKKVKAVKSEVKGTECPEKTEEGESISILIDGKKSESRRKSRSPKKRH